MGGWGEDSKARTEGGCAEDNSMEDSPSFLDVQYSLIFLACFPLGAFLIHVAL